MIYLDEPNEQTICACDRCGLTEATSKADGKAPADWMTGQLWLDVSLSQQRQTPICFCPDCAEVIVDATMIQISAASVMA